MNFTKFDDIVPRKEILHLSPEGDPTSPTKRTPFFGPRKDTLLRLPDGYSSSSPERSSCLDPGRKPFLCHRKDTLHRPPGILRLLQVFFNIFRSYLRRNVRGIYIYCAQRGVPPLAARPSPEKFFIVSMIIAMRKRITPSGTMLCACILKAATCWRCRLTNTSNGHEV